MGAGSQPARLPVGLPHSLLTPLPRATSLSGHVSPDPGSHVSCSVLACLPSAPLPCPALPTSVSLSLCSIPFSSPPLPACLSLLGPSPRLCLWSASPSLLCTLAARGWSSGSPASPLPASLPPWSLNQPSPARPPSLWEMKLLSWVPQSLVEAGEGWLGGGGGGSGEPEGSGGSKSI